MALKPQQWLNHPKELQKSSCSLCLDDRSINVAFTEVFNWLHHRESHVLSIFFTLGLKIYVLCKGLEYNCRFFSILILKDSWDPNPPLFYPKWENKGLQEIVLKLLFWFFYLKTTRSPTLLSLNVGKNIVTLWSEPYLVKNFYVRSYKDFKALLKAKQGVVAFHDRQVHTLWEENSVIKSVNMPKWIKSKNMAIQHVKGCSYVLIDMFCIFWKVPPIWAYIKVLNNMQVWSVHLKTLF